MLSWLVDLLEFTKSYGVGYFCQECLQCQRMHCLERVSRTLCICLLSWQASAKLACRPLGIYKIIWSWLLFVKCVYKCQLGMHCLERLSRALCICLFSWQAGTELACRPLDIYHIIWRWLLLPSVSTMPKNASFRKSIQGSLYLFVFMTSRC